MKILVVDDSRTNLAVAKKYLEDLSGISAIVLCNEPEKAKSIIDEMNIDILLLDVVMPIVSGFDILEILRADHRYDDMPIIMFTSLSDDESFKKCFDLGATDYVNKPIHAVEFKARMKAAIDGRKKAKRLAELLQEISDQNNRLKESNTKLLETKSHLVQSEKMAAIGQLAAGIAHEINNPMGFVSNNCDTLSKYFIRILEYLTAVHKMLDEASKSKDPAHAKSATEILELYRKLKLPIILEEIDGLMEDSHDGIQRVSKIVQSLRTFARTANDEDKQNSVLLDLINQVVLISKNEVKYVAEVFVFVDEDVNAYCNEVQLGQVLINIIVNAAQAIKTQRRSVLGRIDIRASQEPDHVRIEIEDDGPGISADTMGKIFDPFFTTKDVGQGTGLGLSISYDIITNKHSGIIEAESTVGKGTKFIILLPSQQALTE